MWHNLLLRPDGLKLDYDGFGRLTRRQDKNGIVQHFTYDDEQRVKEIRFEGNSEFRRVEYRYDPLGRRTHKILWRYAEKDPETIRFDWQGLQLAGEQSDREPDHYVQYVYTEGSYEPLARVDSVFDDCEIYWYHTELNGLPERVTDADGQTVWRGQFSTWGKTERELSVPQWQVPQNLRFQGQYLDRESGLHYNLFRYYDPVAGRYTQMDPIGLLGGINTYGYVPDPLTWVDPLGLCFSKRLGDFGESHAQSQLKASGNYADVFSVQNKSNNGIDLVGLRHDGKYDFFEVKTNTTGSVGKLSDRQQSSKEFIETVLRNDVPKGGYDLNGHVVDEMLDNIGDTYVIDVFVGRSANGRWFVSKYLMSIWE